MSQFTIETEQKEDGRWLAVIMAAPSVRAYGKTKEEAIANAHMLLKLTLEDQYVIKIETASIIIISVVHLFDFLLHRPMPINR